MIKRILLTAMSVLLLSSVSAFANTANYTPATGYTDGTLKLSDDTFTTRIYEGTTVVCSSTSSSCTFVAPACGSGTHTYYGRTYSSKFTVESANSATATWTAPVCPKTPKPPTLLNITTN